MAEPREEIRKPRYKDTVLCLNCDAEYKPDANWVNGFYEDNTTGRYVTIDKCPEGKCPLCRR